MRRHAHREERRRSEPSGFTLVELLVVIAIIALIISLILVAAADGVRRAEERATQSLITKLETGLSDRLDALLNAQAPVNQTHRYLGAINYSNGTNYVPITSGMGAGERRAQVIAQFDYIRAELPDVFFVNKNTSDGASFAKTYPLNFAGAAYPDNTGLAYSPYYLPLGNLAAGLPTVSVNPNVLTITYPTPNSNFPLSPITGIFGASFSAIGGITKNLGYAPQGYDGVDNNGDGQIDEMVEGVPAGSTIDALEAQVNAQLANHTHKTARAEMLYAILVNGLGPLGSVFNADEFTAREVRDTDNDGLPEFVDAWGEPLQFYRWPIYFGGGVAGSSDLQQGSDPYLSFSEVRQLDPLDPNQLLTSPGWWSAAGNPAFTFSSPGNTPAGGESQAAVAFMTYFHILVDPFPGSNQGTSWDRTGSYNRRAYFSKFLILSAGPDKEPGVAGFGRDYSSPITYGTSPPYAFPTTPYAFPNTPFPPDPPLTMAQATQALLWIENQASQTDPTVRSGTFLEVPDTKPTATTTYLQLNVGLDDISNHNIQAPSTGVR